MSTNASFERAFLRIQHLDVRKARAPVARHAAPLVAIDTVPVKSITSDFESTGHASGSSAAL
jgi:hypothetical protein